MKKLAELQSTVMDKSSFNNLGEYFSICQTFLNFLDKAKPTRIISPSSHNYIFYQYNKLYQHRITRPLNSDLFFDSDKSFKSSFDRFIDILSDLKQYQSQINEQKSKQSYLKSNEINKVIYTLQQSIGCIGDSFDNPNQCRKRVGQLFEKLIKLIIQEVGITCESRTIKVPIPGYDGYQMSYEFDLVFSRNKVVIASESEYIDKSEVVGSVKTTSKDRLDKIFLDKYMLKKLLGRDIPVIAIFLHDVQRAKKQNSIFGINSTFKSNHFLSYTVVLNRLDGVYYIDPLPIMLKNNQLHNEIQNFQQFLVQDLWTLSDR